MNILLKGCPRCGGDVVRQRIDHVTLNLSCLQCGRDREVFLRPMTATIELAASDAVEAVPLRVA